MIIGHHPPCFEEINEAVEALTSRPVVFGAAQYPNLIPTMATIYNLDLVGVHFEPHLFARWPVWDFCQQNIKKWREAGREDVIHVPVGYHPSMARFARRLPGSRDVDVAFFGSMNPRRRYIFDRLQSYGVRVVAQFQATRAERDALLSRTRIGLNMLYHPNGVYPVVRAAHLVANRVPMVSEEAPESPVYSEPHLGKYQDLVAIIRNLLRHPDHELDLMADANLYLFKKYPLTLPNALS